MFMSTFIVIVSIPAFFHIMSPAQQKQSKEGSAGHQFVKEQMFSLLKFVH